MASERCPRCQGAFYYHREYGLTCINCGHCVNAEALKALRVEEQRKRESSSGSVVPAPVERKSSIYMKKHVTKIPADWFTQGY